jgi:hypothetical protein
MRISGSGNDGSSVSASTHIGNPAENIGIKANVVLRNIYAALNEDLTL